MQASRGTAVGAVLLGALVVAVGAAAPRAVSLPTRAQLQLMPLPRSSYASAAASFTAEADSGWFDNSAAARADIDPTMTAPKLERMGRITGYSVAFTEPTASSQADRLINVGSGVDLFRSEAGSARYVAHVASEFRAFNSKRLVLDNVSTFPVNGLRKARGLHVRVRTPSLTTWVTTIVFQNGVIAANVGLVRADNRDIRADVRTLAGALDRRIRGVLAGSVHDSPLPKPGPKLGGLGPPPGGPNPALMGIRSTDFVSPLKVRSQFYERNSADLAEYVRSFGNVIIGSALLATVTADVELRPSTQAATAFLAERKALFTGSQSRVSMRRAIASGLPEYVRRDWQIGTVSSMTVRTGDESVAFEASLTANGVHFDSVVCTVRRRSVIETLTLVSGPDGTVAPELTLRLARAAVAHIDAALRR
jgi:hypothetical protein